MSEPGPPRQHGVRGFITGLWRMVFYEPIRFGTLDLSSHSRGVAGITWGVAVLYGLTVGSVLVANPLRSLSDLTSSVNGTTVLAVPVLLVPAVLSLLGISFGLLLAGSQHSPWWRRILYLIVVWGAVISVVGIAIGLGSSAALGVLSAVLAGGVLVYSIVMWSGRTTATVDAFVLVVMSSGVLLTAYRSLVLQNLTGTESGELITVSFILTQVASLALPLAFLSGVNATAFGVSFLSWSGVDIGRRARRWFVALFLAVVLGWQWQSVLVAIIDDPDAVGGIAREITSAAVLIAVCSLVWWGVNRRVRERVSSPVDVATTGVAVAVPVAYGVTAPAFISAFLGALVASLSPLLPAGVITPLTSLLEIVAASSFVTFTRVVVVIGLIAGAVVLMRRGAALPGAIAAVYATVLASVFWWPLLAPQWQWTPPALGDVGLICATALVLVWSARRSWDRERSVFVTVLALISALVRQADFFALPLGFVIGASAVALLIVGLVWGFLTDGGEAHDDSPAFPSDRRLLVLLGGFLFAITVVAWAVLGKDVGTSAVLSAAGTQALFTVGSAMMIAVALAAASPWIRPRSSR